MNYAIYAPNGRIRQISTTSQPEELSFILAPGEDYILAPDEISDATHYVLDGEFVEIPPQPNTYSMFNWDTKLWEDPRTLEQIKEARWNSIKQQREAVEFSGFTWDGSVFDSDALSQSRIQGAVQLAQMDPGFTIAWTLQDNSIRALSASDMVQVGIALGVHANNTHTHARILREAINNASTVGEVESVVW